MFVRCNAKQEHPLEAKIQAVQLNQVYADDLLNHSRGASSLVWGQTFSQKGEVFINISRIFMFNFYISAEKGLIKKQIAFIYACMSHIYVTFL